MALSDFFRFDAGDVPGFVAMIADIGSYFRNKPGSTERAAIHQRIVQQHVPHLFGIGRTDKAIFEDLRTSMNAEKRRVLDVLMGRMECFERNILRLTVVKLSCGSETQGDKVVSLEGTAKDRRVAYLESLADDVTSRMIKGDVLEDAAADQVLEALRTRDVIARNPMYQKLCSAIEELEKCLREFFGNGKFEEYVDKLIRKHPEIASLEGDEVGIRVPSLWECIFGRRKAVRTAPASVSSGDLNNVVETVAGSSGGVSVTEFHLLKFLRVRKGS